MASQSSKCQPNRSTEGDGRRHVDDNRCQPAAKPDLVNASLRSPVGPPRVLRLVVGLDRTVSYQRPRHCGEIGYDNHDRDRGELMSLETEASGAFHNQVAMAGGPSATAAASIHRFGLSIAKTTPMMVTVATQAARTSCFC